MNASPPLSVAKLCDARFRGMETQDVEKKETQNEGGETQGGTDGKGSDAGIRGKEEGRFELAVTASRHPNSTLLCPVLQ